jgi:catechol 2,3-dioxygenase-like lactoylglutathione lyase family enzyme
MSGLDHIGLTVSDIERSLEFWRDLLGCTETGRGVVEWEHLDRLVAIDDTRIEWVELRFGDGQKIELQQYHRPPGTPVPGGTENEPGRSHVGLRVEGLEDLFDRLHAAGVRSRSARPVTLARGSYAGWRAVYVLDPDGYGIELMQPPPASQDQVAS